MSSKNGAATAATVREATLDLDEINLGFEGTQMRPDRDPEREAFFEELYEEGRKVPRVVIYRTPEGYLVVDGWNRIYGRMAAGFVDIDAIIHEGKTVEEALEAAAGANSEGSKPRCRMTLRNSIFTLCDIHGADKSPKFYAELAKVTFRTAATYLEKYRAANNLGQRTHTEGADGKKYPARLPKKDAAGSANGKAKKVPDEVVETFDPEGVVLASDDDEDAPEVVIRPDIPDNAPKRAKEAAARAEEAKREKHREDMRWLASLKRDNGEPSIREELPEHKRSGFDAAALQYRDFTQSREHKDWVRKAIAHFGLEAKGKGARGPVAVAFAAVLQTDHPRDWVVCYTCKGTGKRDQKQCPSCVNECGFRVK